jgi:hypothetical protein
MLRELLARAPGSKHECVDGVDDVIDFLERNVTLSAECRGLLSRLDYPIAAKTRLS